MSNENRVIVDPEFKNLIPPPSTDERTQLEANLLSAGCRDPLVVWKGHGILLDGHTRHEICQTHGLDFDIAEKGDIAAVQQMESTGTLPEGWVSLSPAQRIYQQQMSRLSRYRPVIQWWNDRLRELSPDHFFTITTAASLADAKKLLELNKDKVPENLWKAKNAPYFIPVAALAPYGVKSIERLLATEGFSARTAPLESVPAVQQAKPIADESVLARMFRGGRASQAYRFLVDRLFSRPGFEIEHAVGVFLTANPFPRQNQIAQFMESLPDDLAEDVEDAGWDRIVREIDRQVLEAGRQPEMQAELTQLIAESPRAIVAAVDTIRRVVFVRTNQVIFRKAG